MQLWNKLPILFAALALFTLVGCGTSSNQAVAPPSGTFSNSNLNGTYVFSFSGEDIGDGAGNFFAMLGTVTANGSGSFTGGTLDIVDHGLGVSEHSGNTFNRLPTSGNYTITGDGRGSGTISATINGANVQFGVDFVLTSNSHGMITRFDSYGSGSGTIDLQASDIAQGALQGSYAFGLDGVDSTTVNPLATVGALTLDGSGNVTTGSQDFSDNGDSVGLKNLPVRGTVLAGAPGSAQLTTNALGFGALQFDAFVIDPTHFKLIETDSKAYLEGDAFLSTGQTSFPTGPLVFALAGEDTVRGPFAGGGLLTSDGISQITSGLEDINDDGYVQQAPSVRGAFTSNGPRTVLTLNGLYNGNFSLNTPGLGNYTFAAYPYAGGAFLLEIDNGGNSTPGISGGNLYTQTATSLNSSQGYALNLSGANDNGEVDMISEFVANGTNMNGLYDVNNMGYLASDLSLGTGNYTTASNGRGTASFPGLQTSGNSFISALNLTYYVVDSSTAVFIETDGSQLGTGAFELQTSTTGSPSMQARPSFMRPVATSKATPQFRQ